MKPKAIFFGSIGTLVETSDLQRRAFNQAFLEAKLDWYWDVELYKSLLKKAGGKGRIQDFAVQKGIPVNAPHLHKRKTEIFNDFMTKKNLPLRPGVSEVISYAKKSQNISCIRYHDLQSQHRRYILRFGRSNPSQ
jgi:beta-phosphoglucomutase-like phosphatase (HAD superfamily)